MSTAEEISRVAIDYAKKWKANNCKESGNHSTCFQYLFSNKYESVSGNPWCAATVSAILADSFQSIGVQNPFRWTLSAWNLYEQAARMPSIRADDSPAPGCVFVYPATAEYTAHTGIVIGVTNEGIYTVEGNSGDAIKCFGCPNNGVVVIGNSTLRSHSQMQARGTVYIHTEEVGAERSTIAGFNWASTLLMLSAALGAWYYARKAA